MTTTTKTSATVSEPMFFDRKSVPSLRFQAGDTVQVWQDGDRKPWTGVVHGCSDNVMSVVGPRGGERGFIKNVNSGFVYGLAGVRDLGLVAKIVKV